MHPKIVYGIQKMMASGNIAGAAILAGVGLIGIAAAAISGNKESTAQNAPGNNSQK